jgi:hypothetical protein
MIFYVMYLHGLAYDWFELTLINFLKNDLENRKTTTMNTFSSYLTLKINLKKVYKGINKERIVKRQLQALY